MSEEPDYAQLLEGISAIPWQARRGEGGFLRIHPRIESLLGHAQTDWYTSDQWVAHLHVDDRDTVTEWLATRSPDMGLTSVEFRACATDGRWIWLQASCIATTQADDDVALTGAMFDVTAQRLQADGLARVNRALRVVNACNTAMLQADNERALLNDICRVSVQDGGYKMAWVGIAEHDAERRVRPIASFGDHDGYLHEIDVRWSDSSAGRGPTGTAIRTGRVAVSPATGNDPQMAPWRDAALRRGFRSSVALPLRDRGEPFGALCIYADENDAFDDESVGLLSRLADNLAFGMTALRDRLQRQQTERYLEALYASSPDMIFIYGEDGRLLDANRNALSGLGLTKTELMATLPRDLLGPGVSLKGLVRCVRQARLGKERDLELMLRTANGELFPAEIRLRRLAAYRDQTEPRVLAMVRDITQQKAEQARTNTLSMALEQTADAVSISDRGGIIEYVNPAFEKITGYGRQEAVGQPQSLLKSGRHDHAFYQRLWACLNAGEPFRDVFINRRKSGQLFYEEKTIAPIRDDSGQIVHFVATGKDITDRMATEERLRYLAHHDVLTGLPNRTLFMDRVEHALLRRPEDKGVVALLFVDLDRFKLINDSLGHDAGDRLLQVVARRLRTCVRQGDTIARLGGDEFGIILEGLNDGQRAADVAQQLIVELSRPVVEKDAELFVTPSIGISLAPHDGNDAQTLLKHADVAMYRAKDRGRDTYHFFSADMSERAAQRLNLETELRYAHERGEFRLFYQPQVRLSDRKVVGVEALLRWDHPTRGLVEPAGFVPVLEETGLIVPVGAWILHQACSEIASLPSADPPISLSVNLSSRQFMVSDVAQLLERALAASQLPASQLVVEITESLILRDDTQTLRALTRISDMGASVAIDDFGTGYSALSYLKRFPIDTLKIDRSFIRDISTDPDDAAIVEAVIAMARSLSLLVVAEGVAEPDQLAFLDGLGCAIAQGYLFGQPSSLVDALKVSA